MLGQSRHRGARYGHDHPEIYHAGELRDDHLIYVVSSNCNSVRAEEPRPAGLGPLRGFHRSIGIVVGSFCFTICHLDSMDSDKTCQDRGLNHEGKFDSLPMLTTTLVVRAHQAPSWTGTSRIPRPVASIGTGQQAILLSGRGRSSGDQVAVTVFLPHLSPTRFPLLSQVWRHILYLLLVMLHVD